MILNGTGHKQLSSFLCKHDDEYKYERIWAYIVHEILFKPHNLFNEQRSFGGDSDFMIGLV